MDGGPTYWHNGYNVGLRFKIASHNHRTDLVTNIYILISTVIEAVLDILLLIGRYTCTDGSKIFKRKG